MTNSHVRRNLGRADPIKEATLLALQRVLDPLVDLMFDAGVTVQDLNKLARRSAVRIATKRVVRESGRESRSRVAIITGLPRSEVGKILDALGKTVQIEPNSHPARRVLAGWHDDSRYLKPNGDPSELPLYGKASFAQLVKKYGGGLPVRAMLDELLQLDAVELLPGQKVIAKTRIPISMGLNSRSISAFGERGEDLLKTLVHNIRLLELPLFEATAFTESGDPEKVRLVKREIAEQGTNFINTVNALLSRSNTKRTSKDSSSNKACRFGVTVFYFQDDPMANNVLTATEPQGRRKNFRRYPRKQQRSMLQQSPD